MSNLLLACDSYKNSHYLQYPPGTQFVYSYIESRGGVYDRTLFFGLQMFLVNYLTKPFTKSDVDEAEAFFAAHGVPFNREGWDYILDAHGGLLPIRIMAVPEGLVVPVNNVLVTVVNTDPKCFWLTSWVETMLLRAVWYPTTVATVSWSIKQKIKWFLEETSDEADTQLPFKLHDFGARGVSSSESAAIGGAAHLVNFLGSDTIEGILAMRRFYGCDMAGLSIPGAEHATITSWGRAGELDAYRNMLTQFGKPGAIFACVSDSFDLFEAIDNMWGGSLRQQVIDSGATVVIRPDSGNPVSTPVMAVRHLADKFGVTVNKKGYKVLNNVRVIQGDGINEDSIKAILHMLEGEKFSADNIAFGMGGALLQGINRDTQKFAMKASSACVNGVWRDVYKAPVTDSGKFSKKGQLALIRENGCYQTVPLEGNHWRNILSPVFMDGKMLRTTTLEAVRAQSNQLPLD